MKEVIGSVNYVNFATQIGSLRTNTGQEQSSLIPFPFLKPHICTFFYFHKSRNSPNFPTLAHKQRHITVAYPAYPNNDIRISATRSE